MLGSSLLLLPAAAPLTDMTRSDRPKTTLFTCTPVRAHSTKHSPLQLTIQALKPCSPRQALTDMPAQSGKCKPHIAFLKENKGYILRPF